MIGDFGAADDRWFHAYDDSDIQQNRYQKHCKNLSKSELVSNRKLHLSENVSSPDNKK
jgi:hypothetical protein